MSFPELVPPQLFIFNCLHPISQDLELFKIVLLRNEPDGEDGSFDPVKDLCPVNIVFGQRTKGAGGSRRPVGRGIEFGISSPAACGSTAGLLRRWPMGHVIGSEI